MKLSIDKVYPYLPVVPPNYTFTYVPQIEAFIVYGHCKPAEELSVEPKKKFAFKVDKQPPILS
jgi:hypothetical protein